MALRLTSHRQHLLVVTSGLLIANKQTGLSTGWHGHWAIVRESVETEILQMSFDCRGVEANTANKWTRVSRLRNIFEGRDHHDRHIILHEEKVWVFDDQAREYILRAF